MGASLWRNFVPYDSDFSRALQRLREDVFARGEFYSRGGKPRSIEALIKKCAEDGTHSAIDVSRVVSEPLPAVDTNIHRILRFLGAVAPLADERLIELFGSNHPTRAMVDANLINIHDHVPRGCAALIVVYDQNGPSELLFIGATGD